MECKEPDCGAKIEASAPLWLSYCDEHGWFIDGVGDDCATIQCTEGHDNYSIPLAKALEAYIESVLPGTTWVGSDPRLEEK